MVEHCGDDRNPLDRYLRPRYGAGAKATVCFGVVVAG
jgi:hypothetical protein